MSTEDLYHDEVETLDDYDVAPDETDEADIVPPLSEPFEEHDHYASHEQPERIDAPGLQSLALDLTLRCGELKLTLGELQRLSTGTIVEVSGIAPGHATLCHGEHVVAEGELVNVDGRLGLQITRLATPS
ncbi:FliM/FliN family flagellar motor switch protein [Pseudomonas sp. Z1-12]|uniref:FliM/FliN family flagellar motor switch protein n=1 Tax=Pseudomonas sp. Z1-12 TaxID=2817408 RepID=UPI003DA86D48